MSISPITEVELLQAVQEYARSEADPLLCWRDFRGKYEQNLLHGSTANEREDFFKAMVTRYRQYPACATLDVRLGKVRDFQRRLIEAMMSLEVPEAEVEGYFKTIEAAKQSPVGVKVAVALLRAKDESAGAPLEAERTTLWPETANDR